MTPLASKVTTRDSTRPNNPPTELHTTAGDVPLHEYHGTFGELACRILHTGAVLTFLDEQILLSERETRLPYGLALWPSAIALAHEIVTRSDEVRGHRVLELGAGTVALAVEQETPAGTRSTSVTW